ncbi:MAG: hypothetical protein ACK5TK_05020 [Betaproteobacteria bacterium]
MINDKPPPPTEPAAVEFGNNAAHDAALDRELRRRIEEVRLGLVRPIPADEVFAEIRRTRLQRTR